MPLSRRPVTSIYAASPSQSSYKTLGIVLKRAFLSRLFAAALTTLIFLWTLLSIAWGSFLTRDTEVSLSMEAFINPSNEINNKILTIFAQSPDGDLHEYQYPNVTTCNDSVNFPIDSFPDKDPFLPWIHDYFVVLDDHRYGSHVRFVAQNKRRCETGEGKEAIMKFWEPQMALFQPVPCETANETRFVCHFHDSSHQSAITFSFYPFNYEYIAWRKGRKAMFVEKGRDVEQFEFSQLLFSCPIPATFDISDRSRLLWLDLIPIRTPARKEYWLTEEHVGPNEIQNLRKANITKAALPVIENSGRWANLPICKDPPAHIKRHRFVVCTWTASSYYRRGDAVGVLDSPQRLREWIVFHRLVGVDHLYVYDNTQGESPLRTITDSFDFVTYIPWPATVCSNNRPNHKNPGERSSQYAAEASCRERFGPLTDWMAFIDTDEYLVPMNGTTWNGVLSEMEQKKIHVLKMRSSRGRPRQHLMEIETDPDRCIRQSWQRGLSEESCLVPRRNETFLRVYNCEFIKPPRPERFSRAMKQIYRPDFVLSHFVHYSTITADIARYFRDQFEPQKFKRKIKSAEWGDVFLDELTEGVLVHTKSVLPHETMSRASSCQIGSKTSCPVGFVCPETTAFDDASHNKNIFRDANGAFCNCWLNYHLEQNLIPRLEEALN